MLKANNPDDAFYWLVGIVAILIFVLVFLSTAFLIKKFSSELRYLNNEIKRTEGAERKFWLCERRKLWLSLIPFVKY